VIPLDAAAKAQSLLDHPCVACCGDCGSRLFCALDDRDDGSHAVHSRVQRDVHDLARDVLSLADALATAERERDAALASADLSARAAVDAARELGHVAAAAVAERDTARSALDGLVAAVRVEREARHGIERAHLIMRGLAESGTREEKEAAVAQSLRAALAWTDAKIALDALLAGAPGGYVEARVVREYLAAEHDVEHDFTRCKSERYDSLHEKRAALDAALAGCV
jgi:hypothetical protein